MANSIALSYSTLNTTAQATIALAEPDKAAFLACQSKTTLLFQAGGAAGAYALAGLALGGPVGAGVGALYGVLQFGVMRVVESPINAALAIIFKNNPTMSFQVKSYIEIALKIITLVGCLALTAFIVSSMGYSLSFMTTFEFGLKATGILLAIAAAFQLLKKCCAGPGAKAALEQMRNGGTPEELISATSTMLSLADRMATPVAAISEFKKEWQPLVVPQGADFNDEGQEGQMEEVRDQPRLRSQNAALHRILAEDQEGRR